MSVEFGKANATGTGTQNITFSLGSNTTRSKKTYTYALSAGSGSSALSGGTLTVTQNVEDLAITYTTGYEGKPTYSDTETTPMVFTGTANGKYLKCVLQSVGTIPGGREHAIGFTSLVESSGSTAQTISTTGTYVEVSNHNSGSYNFTLNLVANPTGPVGDYEVRVYTSDDASGAGELYQSYYISILPYIKIIGDGSIDNSNNYSEYTAEYYPSAPSSGSMVWTVTGPAGASIEGKATVSDVTGYPNKKRITLVDNTLYNYIISISVVNSDNSLIDGVKSGIQCIYSSTQNQNPFEFVDYPSYNTDSATEPTVSVQSEETYAYAPELRLRTTYPVVSTSDIEVSATAENSSSLTATFNTKTKKIWVTFNKNTSRTGKNIGYVLIGYPSIDNATYLRKVKYYQVGQPLDLSATRMQLLAFTLSENSGTISGSFTVQYSNKNSNAYKFSGMNGVIYGYDSSYGPDDPDCATLFEQRLDTMHFDDVWVDPPASGETWRTNTVTYNYQFNITYPSGKSYSDVELVVLEFRHSSIHVDTMSPIEPFSR